MDHKEKNIADTMQPNNHHQIITQVQTSSLFLLCKIKSHKIAASYRSQINTIK